MNRLRDHAPLLLSWAVIAIGAFTLDALVYAWVLNLVMLVWMLVLARRVNEARQIAMRRGRQLVYIEQRMEDAIQRAEALGMCKFCGQPLPTPEQTSCGEPQHEDAEQDEHQQHRII